MTTPFSPTQKNSLPWTLAEYSLPWTLAECSLFRTLAATSQLYLQVASDDTQNEKKEKKENSKILC